MTAASDGPETPVEIARYVTEQVVMSNGCVSVSVSVRIPGESLLPLLTNERTEDLGQSAEIAQEKIGADECARMRERAERVFLLKQTA